MFNLFCLLASSAILFYVIKYRVHVHVTLTTSRRTSEAREGRRAEKIPIGVETSTATTRPETEAPNRAIAKPLRGKQVNQRMSCCSVSEMQPSAGIGASLATEQHAPLGSAISDVTSALVNLGASKGKARAAALKACKEHPDASFDIQFSVALQEVWRAA